MKKTTLVLIGLVWLFLSMVITNFILPVVRSHSNKRDTVTEKIVYSDSYTEELREEVIRQLYGSREQYAKEHTGSRSEYVNKEASMAGKLVIDEERMQAVYDSKLQEFDDMIDSEKVDLLVKEKQEQLVESKIYKDVYKKADHTSREMMYWNSGGKYFAMVELFFMILYVVYIKVKKNK